MPLRFLLLTLVALCLAASPALAQGGKKTMIVSAEGLADPNADTYKRDKGLMIEDLRNDAKRQCIEKAVGSYVESSTLMENYTLIRDKVLTRATGLIKQVIKESPPWVGDDGFAHMLIKCEVYVQDVRDALREMGKQERRSLIKDFGDPKISVAVFVMDADRGSGVAPQRSDVAENILKERFKKFGYRTWSEEMATSVEAKMETKSTKDNQVAATITASQKMAADFFVKGEAKFKKITVRLPPSNIEVSKYALTSWSVKCIDTRTGEEILYNNQVPKKITWPDEDQAIEAIGKLMGEEFSQDFFQDHLQAPSKIYQLQVAGLPSYDVGQELRKEFIGLRPVLNADFREFDKGGTSIYEVEFAGSRMSFNDLLNTTILAPLNQKMGASAFSLDSSSGQMVKVSFNGKFSEKELLNRLRELPPTSVAQAAPARLRDVVKSEATLQKVAAVAPETADSLKKDGILDAKGAKDAVKAF